MPLLENIVIIMELVKASMTTMYMKTREDPRNVQGRKERTQRGGEIEEGREGKGRIGCLVLLD